MPGSEGRVDHLLAGAVGGTIGAIVTCPLEVVKTRLQSSSSGFDYRAKSVGPLPLGHTIWRALRQILVHEGFPGLFRGLGPTIVGVAPARAIYFWAYSSTKQRLNASSASPHRDTPRVHVLAAAAAAIVSSVTTNPLWMVKTRLQLEREKKHVSLGAVVARILRENGIRGFYQGLSASIYGTTETILHFVVYEYLKKLMKERMLEDDHDIRQFLGYMVCGAISKTGATCVAYPHEVARTRLREPGTKYTSFWQSLGLVYKEEGVQGLYRGLGTNLVRQIPNTAVMMATYELTLHLLHRYKAHVISN